jgi:hypothetical protein
MKHLFIISLIIVSAITSEAYAQTQNKAPASAAPNCDKIHQKSQEICNTDSSSADCVNWGKIDKGCQSYTSTINDAATGKGPCGDVGTQIKDACKDATKPECETARTAFRKCIASQSHPATP